MSTIMVPTTEVRVPEKQLLRAHQRDEHKAEIEGMQAMLPNLKSTQDRGAVGQRIKRLEKSLVEQSPEPTLPGQAKDKLAKEAKAIEESVSAGMLSQEEMRKNPAGAVGQHMRWEKANKKKILRWKNIQLMLEPDSNDPDLANFERVRPTGAIDRMRTDAQIPGVMSYGNVPQEKWDQVFHGKGPEQTPLKQARKRRTFVDPFATKPTDPELPSFAVPSEKEGV